MIRSSNRLFAAIMSIPVDLPATVLGLLRRLRPMALTYAGSSAGLLVGSAAQLVTFAVLARGLGATQFGQLLAIIAVTSIAVPICGLGGAEPLVRRVAQNPAIYPIALGHNLILTLVSSAGLLVVLMLMLPWVVTVSTHGVENLVALTVFVVSNTLFMRVVLLTEAIFVAHSQFTKANLVNAGFGLSRALTAILACFVFDVDQLADYALWHGAGHLLAAAVCIAALRPLGAPQWRLLRDELQRGYYFCLSILGYTLRQNIDVLVLSLVAPPALVGSFGVARRIADTSFLTVTALNRIMYPKLSVAMEHGVHPGLPIARKNLGLALLIAAATALAVYFVAPAVLVLFGSGYDDLVLFLRQLCWVIIPVTIASVGLELLGASGNQKMRALILNMSMVGSALIAALAYFYLAQGTIVAVYLVESAIALGTWVAIADVVRREGARPSSLPSFGAIQNPENPSLVAKPGAFQCNEKYFSARERCPTCGSEEIDILYHHPLTRDPVRQAIASHYRQQGPIVWERLEGTDYVVCDCRSCQLIYQKHIPNAVMLDKIYNEMIAPQFLRKLETDRLTVDNFNTIAGELEVLFRTVGKPPSDLRFLDYGFGYGRWSRVAKAMGAQVFATEISPDKIAMAGDIGVRIITDADLPQMKFDIIHTEQVFEHLTDPADIFRRLSKSLARGGLMKVAVPPQGTARYLLKTAGMIDRSPLAHHWDPQADGSDPNCRNYAAIVPLEHLNAFSAASFEFLAEKNDLQIVSRVRRQSVPISMLSLRLLVRSTLKLARVGLRPLLGPDSGYYLFSPKK